MTDVPSFTGGEFLTVKESADLLGVTKVTVQRAIQEGRLYAERAGNRVLILRRTDVEEWGEKQRKRIEADPWAKKKTPGEPTGGLSQKE